MRFPGILPALTTPFDERGEVDTAALAANVRFLLDAGVHGLVATGTMGEAGSLSAQERRLVVETVAAEAAGEVPVIAGVSSGTAAASIAYAADAAQAGAGVIMLLPPLGYRADARELERFYATVAGAAGLPVMLYNNPEASGVDLRAELIVAARRRGRADRRRQGVLGRRPAHPGAAGRRASARDPRRRRRLGARGLLRRRDRLGHGRGRRRPARVRRPLRALPAGELDAAREVYQRLLPLGRFDMTPKLVQYFKAAMDECGLAGGPVRPPRLALTEHEHADLLSALAVLREGVPA